MTPTDQIEQKLREIGERGITEIDHVRLTVKERDGLVAAVRELLNASDIYHPKHLEKVLALLNQKPKT